MRQRPVGKKYETIIKEQYLVLSQVISKSFIANAFVPLFWVLNLTIWHPALAAEPMNEAMLHSILQHYAQEVTIENNVISFEFSRVPIYCIFDAKADRMRMLSPIAQTDQLSPALLERALQANYHTVLDARYAIGNNILYAAFIHPLSALTRQEIESAVRQVATAARTFGSSFTSGELVFPGNSQRKIVQPKGKKETI